MGAHLNGSVTGTRRRSSGPEKAGRRLEMDAIRVATKYRSLIDDGEIITPAIFTKNIIF
jgi:hypothetical protein